MAKETKVMLGFEARDVYYLESTELAYVSTCVGVIVFKGTKCIRILGNGPAMAFSPSGKYLLTGGGIYRTEEPFDCVQDMRCDIESATFLGSDSEVAVVIRGEIVTYFRGVGLVWSRLKAINIDNGDVRQIIYGRGVVAALMKSGCVRSLDSDIFEDNWRMYFRTLSIVPRRLEWTDKDTRLVCGDGLPCVVSGDSIWKMNWKKMGDVVISHTKHQVDTDSRDYELIVFRGSCRTSRGLYSVSACGMYLNMPAAAAEPEIEPETLKQTKTGRQYGVVTRSQTRANEKLKSVIKSQNFF